MRVSVLSVFVASWMPSIFGIIIDIYPALPMIKDNVILKVSDIDDTFLLLSWYKGENTNSDQQIIWLNSRKEIRNGIQMFPEANLFPNGSLEIRNAQKNHSGYYTVSVQAQTLSHKTVSLTIGEEVKPTPDPNDGLTVGQIIGIIVGVVAFVLLVVGLGTFFYKKYRPAGK